MPFSLNEIARALNAEWLVRDPHKHPHGVSSSREERKEILAAQRKERQEFEKRRAFGGRR
jgi:hypothetical protein